MALACNQDHVTFPGEHSGCFDRLRTVRNAERMFHIGSIQAGNHIFNDLIRFLETGIVGGQDQLIAQLGCLLRHDRALSFVAVAATANDRDHTAVAVQHLMDAVEHVRQCVRRMGIVHDCRISRWRLDRLETTGNRMQIAQHHQHFFRIFA